MNKEQLIKIIELMPIEELMSLHIEYYSEKKDGYSRNERKLHQFNYGKDGIKDIKDDMIYMQQQMERIAGMVEENSQKVHMMEGKEC